MAIEEGVCLQPLEDVARRIAAKEISPVELTDAVLARVERLNPRLNAYMTVTAEQARAAAQAAEREIAGGRYRGALHGIPVAIKDLFDTKGIRTTAGSKIMADRVPNRDATVVAKLAAAGAISTGKLGMHEFAYGVTSDNTHYGPVRNPWNLDHVPGGSSGGSGAATAAGLAFATLGSDTGGSIRIPAAVCGCVGLMPTYGRASLYGAVPLSWTLDHAGPLARTVRDAAIVMQAISGHDALDPTTERVPVPDWLQNIERGPKGLRIGVPKQYFWDNCDAEVLSLVRKALAALEAAGAQLVEAEFPHGAAYRTALMAVMFAEAAAFHAETFPSRRDEYGAQVAALLQAGHGVTGIQYVLGVRALQQSRAGEADAMLEGVDVWAMPTAPVPAPTIEASRAADPAFLLAQNTGVFDFTGQPAIAVPCGLTSQKLPASIMFAARRWDETSVLWAGRAYEQVRGEFPAPPVS
jgi:aspartyl-tRNA(Asn)/glutamyl-tRNA(Gln) amidotransferase subunit A